MLKSLLLLLLLANTASAQTPVATPTEPLRLALSAVMLGEQQEMLLRWQNYLATHLQRPVVFVQRRSYREMIDGLAEGKIDAGWICSVPHLRYPNAQRLLAVAVWQGKPLYQSYLIVPSSDKTTQSLADLRGKSFAYSDPESNSGRLIPDVEVQRLGAQAKTFFSKTLFTYSHRKSVMAVADGLVQGANVDAYVYAQLARFQPDLIARTRLVSQSPEYGFPPFVASTQLPDAEVRQLRAVLLGMTGDAEGRALLAYMGLDGFIAGDEKLFAGVVALMKELEQYEKITR
ncbi:MAG: PhnD/SsuA/transferrin family substrate-binding protein [Sideroxydans sp.]|nr:PhnD/SsuA/transferrin family substrate-binding protein [Sideroxydans sp.]